MNQQLPVKDITYGTKRHGERKYNNALSFFSMIGKLKKNSIEVVTTSGETFITNAVKRNSSSGVVVFSDRRMFIAEIDAIKTTERREFDVSESVIKPFDKSTQSESKTFHLILNKAHATNKAVAVFMKNGTVVRGCKQGHDFDSVTLQHGEYDFTIIMYDAVKRIVPLEADGSLAE